MKRGMERKKVQMTPEREAQIAAAYAAQIAAEAAEGERLYALLDSLPAVVIETGVEKIHVFTLGDFAGKKGVTAFAKATPDAGEVMLWLITITDLGSSFYTSVSRYATPAGAAARAIVSRYHA